MTAMSEKRESSLGGIERLMSSRRKSDSSLGGSGVRNKQGPTSAKPLPGGASKIVKGNIKRNPGTGNRGNTTPSLRSFPFDGGETSRKVTRVTQEKEVEGI